MKKFLISLFILIIFSAFVFFFGWTQYQVKPGEFGVVFSKTNGIDETPIQNGEFSWYWQFLLPTNAILKTFTVEPVFVTKQIKGTLPSGDFYASYTPKETFDYSFEFSMSLTVSPQDVIKLLQEEQISNQQDLTQYISRSADTIAQLAANFYLKKIQENPKFRLESVKRDELLRAIKIYEDCPLIQLMSFSLTSSKIPDFELYDKLKLRFFENSVEINNEIDTEAQSEFE